MLRTLIFFAVLTLTTPALAQPRTTSQFYANDQGQYAWTTDNKRELRTTTWFVKYPSDASDYSQITAVIYNREPHFVYYLDKTTKRVLGRLDLKSEKFSLLTPEQQKLRQALEKYDFPTPTALPRISQLLPQPQSEDNGTTAERLKLPPPTFQHPRLERSEWESNYMSADRFRIRSIIRFNGNSGTYQLQDKPGTGRLSEVTYKTENDSHIIRGKWALGRSNGHFTFEIPKENLNVFWGEFGFNEGKTVGAWDGIRRTD